MINSKWTPDQPLFNITKRLSNFEAAILCNFKSHHGKSNLTKFQARILQEIPSNDKIIIAHANKNLGPVGVNTENYIR